MEVLVDSYLGPADEDGWWLFSGRLKDVPAVRVTIRFSDKDQAKQMRASLLKGEVTTCGSHEDFVDEIEIEDGD